MNILFQNRSVEKPVYYLVQLLAISLSASVISYIIKALTVNNYFIDFVVYVLFVLIWIFFHKQNLFILTEKYFIYEPRLSFIKFLNYSYYVYHDGDLRDLFILHDYNELQSVHLNLSLSKKIKENICFEAIIKTGCLNIRQNLSQLSKEDLILFIKPFQKYQIHIDDHYQILNTIDKKEQLYTLLKKQYDKFH